MKVRIPLIMLLLIGAVLGYLLATEKGRGQRDQIMGKVREHRAGEPLDTFEETLDSSIDVTDQATEAVGEAAETLTASVD